MRNKKTTAGADIIAGLRAFRDAVRNGERVEDRFLVRTVVLDLEPLMPGEYDEEDVRAVRSKLRVSQAVFAQMLGVSTKLVQAWEQGTRKPAPLARHVLDDMARNSEQWLDRLTRATRRPSQGSRERQQA